MVEISMSSFVFEAGLATISDAVIEGEWVLSSIGGS
jgi:hypothetical protein